MIPAGFETATFRFVAQHLNYCVTAVPNRNENQEYFLGGKRRPVLRADKLTTFMWRMSWNLGASTSWNTLGPLLACNGTALYRLL